MKHIAPRDWTRTEVCTPYPATTPRKATCRQHVREFKKKSVQWSRSWSAYNSNHYSITACLEKTFKSVKIGVSFGDLKLHLSFVSLPCVTLKRSGCISDFLKCIYSLFIFSLPHTLSAILKWEFYLLLLPDHV